MSESNDAVLISTPSESSITMGSPRGGSNKRALKVAGLTVLACVLVAGQAFTAYMAYSQKQQLRTLESRTDRLQEISSRSLAVRAPVKMHLPMSSLPLAFDDTSKDKDSSTQCQKDAAGNGKVLLPTFRPKCDDKGDYLAQQCWDGTDICWCVDKNGVEIADSATTGPAQCEGTKLAQPVPMKPLLLKEKQVEQ